MTQAVKKAAVRRGYIALGLAIAVTAGVAAPRTAAANSCDVVPGAPSGTISYEDRQEILDLIYRFSWVFDQPGIEAPERRAELETIFTPQLTYTVCSNEQIINNLPNDVPIDTIDKLFTQIDDIYKTLKSRHIKPSHLISNTILTPTAADTVEEKSIMVLVLQKPEEEFPTIDYSAIVRGVIKKDSKTGHWRFTKRTLNIGTTRASYAR